MKKSLLIIAVLLIGILIPQANTLKPLIRYSLMIMLFLSFLKIKPGWEMFTRAHVKILLMNMALPIALFYLIQLVDLQMATAALIVALAPTAVATPIIADLMKRDIAYTIASIILTSLGMAIVIPFILQLTIKVGSEGGLSTIVSTILITVFVPFFLSQIIVQKMPRLNQELMRFTPLAFVFFLSNIFIAGASASQFIRYESETEFTVLIRMLIVIGLVCLLQFRLGRKLDRKELAIESSLSLGRKNTMMALWIALTYIDPLTALGPICYILWQNVYNAWEIWREE